MQAPTRCLIEAFHRQGGGSGECPPPISPSGRRDAGTDAAAARSGRQAGDLVMVSIRRWVGSRGGPRRMAVRGGSVWGEGGGGRRGLRHRRQGVQDRRPWRRQVGDHHRDLQSASSRIFSGSGGGLGGRVGSGPRSRTAAAARRAAQHRRSFSCTASVFRWFGCGGDSHPWR